MWVLKLGGSLARTPQLTAWLRTLAELPRPPVLVPGGGPFADAVRAAQGQWGFDDAAAHAMAILGMEQMGHMLCALQPGLTPVRGLRQMYEAAAAGTVPVWLPGSVLESAADVETSWDLTSDSLALWLAARLNADGVVLVKSAPLDGADGPLPQLQQAGIVDPALGRYLARLCCPLWLLQRDRHRELPDLLDGRPRSALRVSAEAT